MLSRIASLSLLLGLCACAPSESQIIVSPDEALHGPRELSIEGESNAGVAEDEVNRQLLDAGFRIKRWSHVADVSAQTQGGSVSGHASATRYILQLRWGVASASATDNCVDLNYFRADLIDTQINEVVLSARGRGQLDTCYGENHLVRDVISAITKAWEGSRKDPSPPSQTPSAPTSVERI